LSRSAQHCPEPREEQCCGAFWRDKEERELKQIYLDRDQCERFEVEYFEADNIALRADMILASKAQGYDQKHTRYLQQVGARYLSLARERSDAPGWYNVG
tara:strand:- start:350 stop:649 length:300 start_codon:yes stop_codon:yes gene_type:complete